MKTYMYDQDRRVMMEIPSNKAYLCICNHLATEDDYCRFVDFADNDGNLYFSTAVYIEIKKLLQPYL